MNGRPNYVVSISGGAGKSVMFSGVAKNIKSEYSEHDLIVVTPYPELLINLPYIDRVYRVGSTPYLYEDFVQGEDNKVSAIEPYGDGHYLQGAEHLIRTWSRLLCPCSVMQMPKIDINARELSMFTNKNAKLLRELTKPVLVINPFGGPANQESKYNWCRDIPFVQAQEIVNAVKDEYTVIQIARPDQMALSNCGTFNGPLRDICCLLKVSSKRILIDSFCQHAAAALNLASTVCWITNKPTVFGYDLHANVQPAQPTKKVHRIDSLFQSDIWDGSWAHYFPYEDFHIFDVQEVLRTVFN